MGDAVEEDVAPEPRSNWRSNPNKPRKRMARRSGQNDRSMDTPHRVEIRKKEADALAMRIAGVSYKQIAERLGWNSAASAHKAVERILAEQVQEPSQQLRQMEVARLDRMLQALWPAVQEGKWLAIDRVLKVMERKAALLGLDAPQRRIVDVITHDAWADHREELERQLAELEAGKEPKGAPMPVDLRQIAELVENEAAASAEIVDAEVVPDVVQAAS